MLRDYSGITLVELVIVTGIIVVLLSLAAVAFNNYQVRYNIENEIKTLYSDIMGARMRAMNENRPYVVKFTGTKSYVTAIDNNGDGDFNAGDTRVDKYSKDGLKYDITYNLLGNTNRITLNSRGLLNINGSVRITRQNSSEYDCIVISNTRIKMGKWDGSECNPR